MGLPATRRPQERRCRQPQPSRAANPKASHTIRRRSAAPRMEPPSNQKSLRLTTCELEAVAPTPWPSRAANPKASRTTHAQTAPPNEPQIPIADTGPRLPSKYFSETSKSAPSRWSHRRAQSTLEEPSGPQGKKPSQDDKEHPRAKPGRAGKRSGTSCYTSPSSTCLLSFPLFRFHCTPVALLRTLFSSPPPLPPGGTILH